eukprot:COSAG02_NODE_19661_length_870_cov_19.079118_1_plen_73_part_01
MYVRVCAPRGGGDSAAARNRGDHPAFAILPRYRPADTTYCRRVLVEMPPKARGGSKAWQRAVSPEPAMSPTMS